MIITKKGTQKQTPGTYIQILRHLTLERNGIKTIKRYSESDRTPKVKEEDLNKGRASKQTLGQNKKKLCYGQIARNKKEVLMSTTAREEQQSVASTQTDKGALAHHESKSSTKKEVLVLMRTTKGEKSLTECTQYRN